ncbi:LysR family transcriptional regulator [Oscillibacter sp. GMB15532]|uniref:LysR family transcriptional regulator n=1 Tax=Oscillibacter sp. GMB15532 TaxID=3230022 RepID=UPI0034DEEA7A
MDEIKFDYIMEIARQKSISKAAKNLFIAQPSLSRYVINLEKQLGVKLFDRSHAPLELTEAGILMVQYIEQSEALKAKFFSKLGKHKESTCTEIKIGVVPWRIPVFLPKIVPEFMDKHHNVKVVIKEGVSQDLEALVLADQIDACVVNGPQNNQLLEYRVLNYEKIVLVASRSSEVAKSSYDFVNNRYYSSMIDLRSLRNEAFILLVEKYRLGLLSRKIFKSRDVMPSRITYVSNMNTALSMSAVGLGLTFMPESGIERSLDGGESPLYFSIGEPEFGFPLIIAFKKGKKLNQPLIEFIDFVCSNYNDYRQC